MWTRKSIALSVLAVSLIALPSFAEEVEKPEAPQPVVQVALLLDTSNSMDGLIDQARQHLWSIVNEFATVKRDGQTPRLEVALFEYGNSGLSGDTGFIRVVQPLTGDLDAVSEGLFSLKTNGGDEYCGQVIAEAVKQLQWATGSNEYRAIFIAGNEPFTQGPVSYEEACKSAIERYIVVNTIHCGGAQEGIDGKWRHGSQLADGSFLTIDQNQVTLQIDAPQDQELARLNTELNATYLWYGAAGEAARGRQLAQDANAMAAAPAAAAQRVASKSTSLYEVADADLVDALKSDDEALTKIKEEELPEALRGMPADDRVKFIEAQAGKRDELRRKIQELTEAREAYVATERKKLAEQGEDTLGDAVLKAVREQAAKRGYETAP